MDGFGDFSSVMWGVGKGSQIEVLGSVQFPHSLGIFYTAFTQFLGFPKYGDEYKMMGLAAYGEPRFAQQVRDVVQRQGIRSALNLDYFVHHTQGVDMTWDAGEPVMGSGLFGKMVGCFWPASRAAVVNSPAHADLAASVQAVLEESYFALLNHVHQRTGLNERSVWPAAWRSTVWPTERSSSEPLSGHLHPAGSARRGHVDWRGPPCPAPGVEAAARFRHEACLLRARVHEPPSRCCRRWRRRTDHEFGRDAVDRPNRAGNCRRQNCRLVPGSHGVRSARLGQPQHSG